MSDFIEVSTVIAAHHPRELAEFYASFNDVEVVEGINNNHFVLFLPNGLKIEFYKPSKASSWPEKGRSCALCFKKEPSSDSLQSLNDWSSELIGLGGKLLTDVKVQSFGAEVWLLDPEGNVFLILVPSS